MNFVFQEKASLQLFGKLTFSKVLIGMFFLFLLLFWFFSIPDNNYSLNQDAQQSNTVWHKKVGLEP